MKRFILHKYGTWAGHLRTSRIGTVLKDEIRDSGWKKNTGKGQEVEMYRLTGTVDLSWRKKRKFARKR